MTDEEFLTQRIEDIRMQYYLDVKPYVDQLIKLRIMNREPIMFLLDQVDNSVLLRIKNDQ